jgi:hypothetical protein
MHGAGFCIDRILRADFVDDLYKVDCLIHVFTNAWRAKNVNVVWHRAFCWQAGIIAARDAWGSAPRTIRMRNAEEKRKY